MQVWFEVPEHLRDSWADVVDGGRYVGKLMKNKIVCDINNISLKAISQVNAQNRQRNTRNHHAGSRPVLGGQGTSRSQPVHLYV